MITCLDCFHCKLIIPVNKANPLLTRIVPTITFNPKYPTFRLKCKKLIWGHHLGKESILYLKINIEKAEKGGSTFLNNNQNCKEFDGEDE